MKIEVVRLDAATQLGDSKQVARSLRYLNAHRAEALGTYEFGLVIANQLDEAARLLVARLLAPGERQNALEAAQTYAQSPATPRALELDARWRAVIARREVQSAINRVGRVDSYRLETPDIAD